MCPELQISKAFLIQELAQSPDPLQVIAKKNLSLPNSILLIADGSGRWAKRHNVPVIEGHKQGAKAIRDMLSNLQELPVVKTAIIWTLSPDNIARRTPEEIAGITAVIQNNMETIVKEVEKNEGRFILLGDNDYLPPTFHKFLEDAEERTRNNTGQTMVLANNYSGEQEILRSLSHLATETVKNRMIEIPKLDPISMRRLFDPRGVGEVDLAIRTDGDFRTSGFGWRIDKAELYFTDTLLPDFSRLDLALALADFSFRERRGGGRL